MAVQHAISPYPPGAGLQYLPLRLLAPLPLPLLQPPLARILRRVLRDHPGLPDRLGSSSGKAFLIDPLNLPFVFLLQPDPRRPRLRAWRRGMTPPSDTRIAGTFLTLLDLIDGELEGDALFFSRDLSVTGDTEAAVALRNALDDIDGSVADSIASALGPPGTRFLSELRCLRGGLRHA